MRILVTGATGFLGGYLVPELARAGHELSFSFAIPQAWMPE